MFCSDLELVLSAAIGTDIPSSDGLTADDASTSANPSLTSKQKEVKKVAKRINKAIQPAVEDAQRKEADLTGKSLDGQVINLDAMLESSLRARRGSFMPSLSGESIDHAHEAEPTSPQKALTNGVIEESQNITTDSALDAGPEARLTNGDVAMEDAPEHLPNGDAEHEGPKGEPYDKDEHTDEAIIRLQLVPGEETVPIINTDAEQSILNDKPAVGSSTSSTATAPALSASGSTNPSTHPHDPLTPLNHASGDHHEDAAVPLEQGGIPWYLEAFEPRGTTIHKELWGGREVMRAMSEDLSEIDDEALEEMMDDEHIDVEGKQVNGVSANGSLAPPDPRATGKKKSKRRR